MAVEQFNRAAVVFLTAWIVFAALTNSRDAQSFNLQHAGVEALVERGTLYVDGSPTPQLKPGGDVFEHNGHLLPMKPPGHFLLGALAYLPIHWFVRYSDNFRLASYLVTIFSSGLLAAAAVAALYQGVRRMAESSGAAWLVAVSFGFGTHFFPYAGVLHHDVVATSFLVISWWALISAAGRKTRRALVAVSGLAGGLAVTGSYLATFCLPALAVYAALKIGRRRLALWLAGTLIGLAPMFVVHTVYLGHPLRAPQQVGGDPFVMPRASLGIVKDRLEFYFIRPQRSLFFYSPICLFGLVGLGLLTRDHPKESALAILMGVFLLTYLCQMGTEGFAQFGPRYLLPWLPFVCLGLIPYATRPRVLGLEARSLLVVVLVPVVAISIGLNLLGALTTVMCPDLQHHAGRAAFQQLIGGGSP